MAGRFYLPRSTAFDANGDPISGAKLGFFESGTTTPLDTFSDDALTVANTNPVIADSAGRFGDIFLQQADYKVELSDASDNVIWTSDPVRADSPKSSDVREVTTTTVLDTSDDGKLITADATSGAFIITLPAAATAANGYEVTVQKIDSSTNIVTVDANGSETINGTSDLDLPDQYASAVFRCDGTTWFATAITPTTDTRILPPDFRDGLTPTNNSGDADHDIDVSTGDARSDDDTGNIVLNAAITKQIDAAFAEGTNQGGLDTGTVAADTVYYIFAIAKLDGTADALFSLSDTAPTLPSGFTLKRIIGSIITDSSSNIIDGVHAVIADLTGWHYMPQVTLSSTTTDIVKGMPSGIRDVEVIFNEATSNTGAQPPLIQLGYASAFDTSGYTNTTFLNGGGAGTNATNSTAGFLTTHTATYTATHPLSDNMHFRRWDAAEDLWLCDGSIFQGTINYLNMSKGRHTVSGGALDRIRATTPGGAATLGGEARVRYR